MQTHVTAAIVLAAGGSRRMGTPKALLPLRDTPLVAAHVRALQPFAASVIVVLGADADAIRAVLPPGVRTVLNPNWACTWPADSLRLALQVAEVRGPCWVTPVDVRPARAATLRALLAAGPTAIPVDLAGREGHPVLLDSDLVARLRSEAPDGGLRTVLGHGTRVTVADPMVGRDFNTPEAWKRWVDGG